MGGDGAAPPLSGEELRRRLRSRADLLARLRAFMAERGVLETQTPMLADAPNWDPGVEPFPVPVAEGRLAYLRGSPEPAMKRLLAAGSGSIYSLEKVFRRHERGRWHEPEFTMLEWYRLDFDRLRLQREVVDLLRCLGIAEPSTILYRQAFLDHAGVDPHTASVGELEAAARRNPSVGGEAAPACHSRGEWLDWLLTAVVIPVMGREPFFLCEYPAEALAQEALAPGEPPRTDRFELFINGVEIANGCSELRDADEFLRRHRLQNDRRRRRGWSELPLDNGVLEALRHGLPPCAGVALGVDRLLSVLNGGDGLSDIDVFPG